MAKPTSLAAQLRREDEKTALEEQKVDAEKATAPASDGKVWVRLVRPHYDSDGFLHLPGVVELSPDKVPSTAKVLTPIEAAEAAEAEED